MKGNIFMPVIPAAGDREYGNIGIDGESVYLITDNQVAAVVSNFSNGKIRPERRHIAAHQAVLKRLMEEETPCPSLSASLLKGKKRSNESCRSTENPLPNSFAASMARWRWDCGSHGMFLIFLSIL